MNNSFQDQINKALSFLFPEKFDKDENLSEAEVADKLQDLAEEKNEAPEIKPEPKKEEEIKTKYKKDAELEKANFAQKSDLEGLVTVEQMNEAINQAVSKAVNETTKSITEKYDSKIGQIEQNVSETLNKEKLAMANAIAKVSGKPLDAGKVEKPDGIKSDDKEKKDENPLNKKVDLEEIMQDDVVIKGLTW